MALADDLMRFDRPIAYEEDRDLRLSPYGFGGPTFSDFLYDSTVGNIERVAGAGGDLLESVGKTMVEGVATLDEVDDLFLEGLESIYEGTASFDNVPKNLEKLAFSVVL